MPFGTNDEVVNSEPASTGFGHNDEVVSDTPSSFEESNPSGISQIPSDINQRGQDVTDIWNKDQSVPSKLWQTAGQVGKTATGVVGRVLQTASPVIEAGVGAITSTTPEERKQAMMSASKAIHENETLQNLTKAYHIFKDDNPELASNLEAGINILSGMTLGGKPAGGLNLEGAKKSLDFIKDAKDLPGIADNIATQIPEKVGDVAARIQGTKVKVNIPEGKKGASNEMYKKYGVFGNAKEVNTQWNKKISQAADELNKRISENAADPENYTYTKDIFDGAKGKLSDLKTSKTDKIKVEKALNDFEEEYKAAYPDGKINLLDAQLEKQSVGKKGDWIARNGHFVTNRDATTDAQAYNILYDSFKKNIDNKGGEGIKEINKMISEMIPMERASGKQVLISNRKNPISMEDFFGGLASITSAAHGNLIPGTLTIANMATKSPTVAKGLYKVSQAMGAKAPQSVETIMSDIAKKNEQANLFDNLGQ